ncbi:MAG TPA: porin family protein [Hyphomicrobium sp.]|nr:porin family protein [Hyphomicrobium sp.]
MFQSTSGTGTMLPLALGAILALSFASGAQAAEDQRFSGAYAGIHVGYGWSDTMIGDGGTNITNPPYGAFSCGPALTGNYCNNPFELSADGALAGLQAGMNWQRGHFVAGLEGDVSWTDIGETRTLFRPFDDRDIATVDYDWTASLAARLGYTTDRLMVYAKAGVAFARLEQRAADIDLTGGQFQIYQGSLVNKSSTETGWAVGGGAEYAFSEAMSAKLEYLYMDFGSTSARSSDGDIYRFENALHSVRLGLNFKLPPSQ